MNGLGCRGSTLHNIPSPNLIDSTKTSEYYGMSIIVTTDTPGHLLIALASFALGLPSSGAGLASTHTSIATRTTTVSRRTSMSLFLSTPHLHTCTDKEERAHLLTTYVHLESLLTFRSTRLCALQYNYTVSAFSTCGLIIIEFSCIVIHVLEP